MKKEYECCVPKEIKDDFLNNTYTKRTILQIIFGLSKYGEIDLELTRNLIDLQAEVVKKDYQLWSKVTSMYPELNPENFTFNSRDFKIFYHEYEGDYKTLDALLNSKA